jgi:virginiamycin B lyase
MMICRVRTIVALLVLAAPVVAGAQQVEIQEWEVPYEQSRPRDPYVAPDGKVWFVGQRTHYVASFDPKTGEFKKFDLPAGAGPHNLIVDDKGTIWYTGNRVANIGKVDPKTGEVKTFPMPDSLVRDPHTMIIGNDGQHMFFTAQGANHVGRFTPATGEVKVVKVQTPRARPYGIEQDSKGTVWVNLFGSNKLAKVDPASLAITEISLPRPDARGRRIAITSDDKIWYVDYAGGYLGRYDPATQQFKEWRAPSATESRPYAMTVDDQDRLWFVETGPSPNNLVGFDPKTEQFFSVTPIQSGGGAVRHMVFHEPTRTIWFGTDENTLGRADVGGMTATDKPIP